MEYRSLERLDEALATFEELRARTPDYVPMYLMCGQMLETMGRIGRRAAWLTSGVEARAPEGRQARRCPSSKAPSERWARRVADLGAQRFGRRARMAARRSRMRTSSPRSVGS